MATAKKIAAKKPLSSQQREFWRKNKKDRIRFVLTDAARILGCDDYWDGRQDLFCYGGGWPAPYNVQYLAAKTPEARAKVAARRINKFISSKGTI